MPGNPGRTARLREELEHIRSQDYLEEKQRLRVSGVAFQQELVAILREHGGLSHEASWEAMAQAICAHFLTIRGQSPLSTFQMLTQAGRMVLLIRMANRRGHVAEQAEELAAFQGLMASVFGEAVTQGVTQGVTQPPLRGNGTGPAQDEEDDDEDE